MSNILTMATRKTTKKKKILPILLISVLSLTFTFAMYIMYMKATTKETRPLGGLRISSSTVQPSKPKIVWLMSFPNSGTSYTIINVDRITNATTATNYIGEAKHERVPVHSDSPQGPFWQYPNRERPPAALTKTHCMGYCQDCLSLGHFGYRSAAQQFERGCGRVERPRKKKFWRRHSFSYYDSRRVSRMVHLFRDPLDNIVSRMHLELDQKNKTRPHGSHQDDFVQWCRQQDHAVWNWLVWNQNTWDLRRHVPCYADFIRWAQWHNRALEMSRSSLADRPVYYLYYENYTTHYEETVDELLQFLQLERKQSPEPFAPGKTYHHYYSPTQQRAIRALLQHVSTSETWKHIKHYLVEYE